MDEIELIRKLGSADAEEDAKARERARSRLLEEIGEPAARQRMPAHRRMALIAGLVAVIVPGAFAVANQIDSRDGLPPWVDPGPPDPVLTGDQEAQGLEIASQDPLLREILEGKSVTVRTGPWGGHGVGGSVEPITGVAFIYELDEPADYAMRDWPVIEYLPESDPTYRETSVRMAVENATEVLVSVDLGQERVVALEPSGDDMVVTPSAELRRQIEAGRSRNGD